jgi:uncharacterized protein
VEQPDLTLAPVRAKERIAALDAVRGFALLGIFMVNIQFFSATMGEMFTPTPREGSTQLDSAAFYGVKTLATGKFYPLFSMLFGMGMAMQLMRARKAGRGFAGFYTRRLVVLGAIGLAHALLLWYGDILFIYALAGAVMMLLINLSARKLVVIGAALVIASALMTGGITALEALAERPDQPSVEAGTSPEGEGALGEAAPDPTEPPEESGTPNALAGDSQAEGDEPNDLERFFEGLSTGQVTEGPTDPLWIAAERSAHAEGPFLHLFIMRALSWVTMLIYWQVLMGGFLHVVAMFCFGAALMKAEFFHAHRRGLQKGLLAAGVLVGLPLSVLATVWPVADESMMPAKFGASIAIVIGGPLVSAAYLSAITLLVEAAPGSIAARAVANLGRLALTNYLMQTILATTLFYYWGFGLFGEVSPAETVGIVLAIYAFQIVFSAVWLRVFRIGPAEWVWRSLTYLKLQPMLRERATE